MNTVTVAQGPKVLKFLQCLKSITLKQERLFSHQLTREQMEVQEMCRNFAVESLIPTADRTDKQRRFPENQIKQLAQMGLMGATVNKKYGGAELDMLALTVAIEEVSRGCASTGLILSIHNCLYANLVDQQCNEEQKQEFLNQYAQGSIGCFALSEKNAGSDVANIETTATEDGNYWILQGKKNWISSAIEAKAAVVFASFDKSLRHNGLGCFLVPLDTEGVFRGKKEGTLGIRGVTSCNLKLEEVRIPKGYLVGEKGQGFKIAMNQLNQARIGVASHAVGIAQAALDTAVEYASKRKAFGKPLTSLHSVKDRLSDMYIAVETARLLTYRAAVDINTKNSSMAKYVAGKNATAVTDHCIQILGGNGLSTSYPAERHYRDARGTQIYGGVTDVQKMLIGQQLLKQYEEAEE